MKKLDAHIHLFERSYQGESFAVRPGVQLDEIALYESYMKSFDVDGALVVAYSAPEDDDDNNAFVSNRCAQHRWIHPLAYVDNPDCLNHQQLEIWQAQGFIGIALYIFDDQDTTLASISSDIWQWLEAQKWLISINTQPAHMTVWPSILDQHTDLRLLVSHLGLPAKAEPAMSLATAKARLQPLLGLARYPNVHVKLSGLYALTEPGHDYPHRSAWPYIEALLSSFQAQRLLWGSDFSPHLDWLSFPQTFELFTHMPFLSEDDRTAILGLNLRRLLDEVG